MYVTLFNATERDTEKYRKRLLSLGIQLEVIDIFDRPEWDGKLLSTAYLQRIASEHYETRGESTDVIQFLLDDWQRKGSRGVHYGRSFSSYRMCIIKDRNGWEDTGEHELLHAVNDIVWLYTGISLSVMFGVDDFDEDVVHGRHEDYREYKYDKVWSWLAPFRIQAVNKRKRLGYDSARQRLMVKLREMVALLRNKIEVIEERITHPVAGFPVSQAYGLENARYPATGRHIGTDYATPIGTPLVAPMDGTVTHAAISQILGNYCHYQYKLNGQTYTARFLHLRALPAIRSFEQGEVIAETGNSGDVIGHGHVHIDVWKGDVQLDVINKHNWATFTVDPQTHYVIQ